MLAEIEAPCVLQEYVEFQAEIHAVFSAFGWYHVLCISLGTGMGMYIPGNGDGHVCPCEVCS